MINTSIKGKLRVIIAITSIFTLLFIAIVVKEYLDEKRRERALKHYAKIAPTVMLADALRMDLECSDKKGNTWVIEGNNKSSLRIVTQDITEYILGEKKELYSYKITENESTQRYIENFNNNMKHIRIGEENGVGVTIPPKTISEA